MSRKKCIHGIIFLAEREEYSKRPNTSRRELAPGGLAVTPER
jgi:hypothetical protein